jgi:selenocysteine-specific elongation factor
MGLGDLPPPVSGEWLADPAHWQRLRQRLAAAVAAHAARDPLAAGLPLDAARAELGLPDRGLVEALVAWRPPGGRVQDGAPSQDGGPGRDDDTGRDDGAGELIIASGGYLRRATGGERGRRDEAGQLPVPGRRPADDARVPRPDLPARVADAVQVVLADLADAPFSAPDAERMRELGIDARAAAAAERAGLLLRLPGNVLLAPDAPDRAARILAGLPQPFTAAEARKALATSRRVVIPLLEWLDRKGITKRLADDRRTMREPPGSPRPNGGR